MKLLASIQENPNVAYVILILYRIEILLASKNKDEISTLKENLEPNIWHDKIWELQNQFLVCVLLMVGVKGCIQLDHKFEVLKWKVQNRWANHCLHKKKWGRVTAKSDDEKEFMSKIPYQYFVNNLMYAMLVTRPEIWSGICDNNLMYAFEVVFVRFFIIKPG